VAAAEAAEGNLRTFMENDLEKQRKAYLEEVTPEAYGVTPEFVEFIHGITAETFVEYPRAGAYTRPLFGST